MSLNESDFTNQEWNAIAFCRAYVNNGPFGFPGHMLMVLVSKLAGIAERPNRNVENSLWRVRVSTGYRWSPSSKYYVVRAETRGEAAAKTRAELGQTVEIASIRLLPDQDVIEVNVD